MTGSLVVVPYDPAWPERFEAVREQLAAALARAAVAVLSIEHVGSTAVPGLAAKPVIDIVRSASRRMTSRAARPSSPASAAGAAAWRISLTPATGGSPSRT